MDKNKNFKVLVVGALIAIIGLGGWYLWGINKKTDDNGKKLDDIGKEIPKHPDKDKDGDKDSDSK